MHRTLPFRLRSGGGFAERQFDQFLFHHLQVSVDCRQFGNDRFSQTLIARRSVDVKQITALRLVGYYAQGRLSPLTPWSKFPLPFPSLPPPLPSLPLPLEVGPLIAARRSGGAL